MSANNWTQCPKCRQIKEAARKVLYGKVSEEEYLAVIQKPEDSEPTFREDYELGIDEDGLFEMRYSGGCRVCGLQYSYRYAEQLTWKVNDK